MKKLAVFCFGLAFAVAAALPVCAGTWVQDASGWWYRNDDGTYPAGGWQWIDGNGDGTAECYYFYYDGYMAYNTTIDGYHFRGRLLPEGHRPRRPGQHRPRRLLLPAGTCPMPGTAEGSIPYGLMLPSTGSDITAFILGSPRRP